MKFPADFPLFAVAVLTDAVSIYRFRPLLRCMIQVLYCVSSLLILFLYVVFQINHIQPRRQERMISCLEMGINVHIVHYVVKKARTEGVPHGPNNLFIDER